MISWIWQAALEINKDGEKALELFKRGLEDAERALAEGKEGVKLRA